MTLNLWVYISTPFFLIFARCNAQVQAKYDTIARLWAALPTDAQLQRRQTLLQADLVS